MRNPIKLLVVFGLTLILASGVWAVYSGRCLKWAIDHNNIKLLDFLLSIKAPVNADFGAYGNPVVHAVSSHNVNAVRALVKHGADVNTYAFRDQSLLAWAYAVSSGPETGETLLSLGADVDFLAIPSSRKTVLMFLLSYKTLDLKKIRSVIKHDPDLQIRDAEGRSSFDYIIARRAELRALGFRDDEP